MAPLGPFPAAPRLAVAVSGGADSLALALLADAWARRLGGSAVGLILDHGLRLESAEEARLTAERLGGVGIAHRVSRIEGLAHGPAVARRAREARFAALEAHCAALGLTDLLLGHHAGDQAETLLIRTLSQSGPGGLAGMAAVRETDRLRLLRPLLPIRPERLRATLRALGLGWVEDPSNADPSALRVRVRARLTVSGIGGFLAEAETAGARRAAQEPAAAASLAATASIRPEGFAIIEPGPLPAAALSALIRAIGGLAYPPSPGSVEDLCSRLRPATLAGARLMAAGRLGRGFLLVRETAAIAPPCPADPGAIWDRRFRLSRRAAPPEGTSMGALGAESAGFRRFSGLPAAVLQTLPAFRCDGTLFAVPHLAYPDPASCARVPVCFSPPCPVACAPFLSFEEQERTG